MNDNPSPANAFPNVARNGGIRIERVATPADRSVWQHLIEADPMGVPYQSPHWFEAICNATGSRDISRLYTMSDGRHLLLPLVEPRWSIGRLRVAGSPPKNWGMGGLSSAGDLQPSDIRAVVADLRSLGFLRLSIRPNPLLGEVWAAGMPADVHASARFAHAVDLRPGFDELWSHRFTKAVRKGVRKAQRNGVDIECDSMRRLLPVYHQLFKDSVERWSQQQREPLHLAQLRARHRDPYAKLEAIVDAMGAKCKVWVATYRGEPASALITIQHGRSIQAVKAAMNKDLAGPHHTNDLIYTRVIEEACRDGLDFYHLGESGGNADLAAFKQRFGAVGHDYAEYFIERLPISNADAILRRATKRLIGFDD